MLKTHNYESHRKTPSLNFPPCIPIVRHRRRSAPSPCPRSTHRGLRCMANWKLFEGELRTLLQQGCKKVLLARSLVTLVSTETLIGSNVADYAGRVRQKSARAEGEPSRDCGPHRAASAGRWRVPHHAGKPDFVGFSRCRAVRAFENRAEAPTSRVSCFRTCGSEEKS